MVTRIGTSRRKTRYLLKKPAGQKGKISLRNFFQRFEQGDRVCLCAEPSYHRGMYFRRFHNMVGKVTRKRGYCYELLINDKGKQKTIIVHPVHLRKE